MSKFKIKLRLEGFELEIEGSRDDASLISQNVGQQIGQMLKPINGIIEAESSQIEPQKSDALLGNASVERKKRRKKTNSSSGSDGDTVTPIDFRHNPEKFSSPTQSWNTLDKSLWLLHVVSEQTDQKEIANAVLVKTFNKHFRQAGEITSSNTARDLGRAKTRKPSLVGQDTTKSPAVWYLTEEGQKRALSLIAGGEAATE